nr:MAG TPA: hypothetical protein [Caudoviricetes sp.]
MAAIAFYSNRYCVCKHMKRYCNRHLHHLAFCLVWPTA